VELIQETVPDGTPDGPQVITVFRVDPRVRGVRVEAALGGDKVWGTDPTFGRETVSRLAARRKAVAGINAGFFPFAGNPIGLHIEDGNLVTEPERERTSFYVLKDGTTGFAPFRYAGTVRAGDRTFVIDGLNRSPAQARETSTLLLFTPVFSPQTLRGAGRYEVILRGISGPLMPGREYTGAVMAGAEGGGTAIAAGTVVLSGGGEGADFLRTTAAAPGAKLSFRVDVTPVGSASVDPAGIAHAVTGAPRILTDSRVDIRLREEGMGQSFSTTRHPRTALGRTRDGVLLFVTVDGRQKGFSRGASLEELANILLRFGATDAVNLDGGGSSAAVVWDAVANSPSEGAERPVADALLVYAADLPRPGSPPTLAAPGRSLQVGETWDFGSPARLADTERAVWGTKGGVGFVSQRGTFRATRPGKGTVFVTLGGRDRQTSVPVTVVGRGTGDAAGFSATLSLVPSGAEPLARAATLVIRIANAEGDPLGSEPVTVEVTGGKADPQPTVTTDGAGNARVTIRWEEGASARAIRVTSPRNRFRDAQIDAAKP
jgi:hypothetical protein